MRGTLVLNRLCSKFFCLIYSEQCLGNIPVAALTLLAPISHFSAFQYSTAFVEKHWNVFTKIRKNITCLCSLLLLLLLLLFLLLFRPHYFYHVRSKVTLGFICIVCHSYYLLHLSKMSNEEAIRKVFMGAILSSYFWDRTALFLSE